MALSRTSVAPTKPHFFKPLLPDFLHGILIPLSFFKYLNGKKYEGPALLKTSTGNWTVKINGRRIMEEGWSNFAKEHCLQVGDFLVFRYEGDMVFNVIVFDSSSCEKEFASSLDNADHADHVDQIPNEDQESSDSDRDLMQETSESDFVRDSTRSNSSPENPAMAPVEGKSCSFKLDHPYFVYTMKPSSLGYNIYIPKHFARLNGLSNRQCEMIIKDEKMSWQVRLSYGGDDQPYIGNGWRSFRDAKQLKEGDTFALELVENGEKPIMHFHWSKKIPNSLRMDCPEEKSFSFQRDHPFFVYTLKYYSFARNKIYIPKNFAKSNGLSNRQCEMLIKDGKSSWKVELGHKCEGQAFIGNGWRSFCDAKDLKKGDTFALELVKKGKNPIMHFHYFAGPNQAGASQSELP